jgi:uncharacterized protein (DUF697 family)
VGAKLGPGAVFGLLKDVRTAASDTRPLQVSGVLAEQLARELGEGGDPGWVRVGGRPERAAALVHVLSGAANAEDEALLKAADRARTPKIVVQTGPEPDLDIPYVLATDVVPCPPGAGFPVEEIATAVARRVADKGAGLAAHVPVLRKPICDELIRIMSRKNGLVGAAVFIPGADLPVLTLNQLRLVMRLAAAHGVEVDAQRVPEIVAVLGNAFVMRSLARTALGFVPVGGWLVKGGVAFAGTRAIGEAAVQYFELLAARSRNGD